jgi:HK97 family phage prohead protease
MTAVRFPNGLERRAAIELRAAAGRRLEGYAAVFDAAADLGGFSETIRPGAFAATLRARNDILALVDHDPGRLLARTSSGTLSLAEDSRGLAFTIALPDTTLGRDVLALAERGDLGGMSFGFRAKAENWPAKHQRELLAVDLLEISVVQAHPAYDGTTLAARARPHGVLHRQRLVRAL